MIISRIKIALAIAGACMTIGAGATTLSRPARLSLADQQNSLGTPAGIVIGEDGKAPVIIILKNQPATTAYASAFQSAGGGSMALNSAQSAAQSAISSLRAEQSALVSQMHASKISFDEIYRVQRVLNGIAVRMRPQDMSAVRKLPNVERVQFLPTYERPSNIASVPFINAPEVWDGPDSLGLAFGATGKGIRIGDIDTGLDYIHPDFGGSGALSAYQDVDPTSVVGKNSGNTLFPTAKVVGGFDFAGDAYNASNAPQPDPNPMDCGGHGTHTAGTIAGVGVNSDGSPYLGAYNPTAPYTANLKIGPGVAPEASLYALRVFGCGGSTNLVTQAIDWAVDPNNDGDFSDRLDVINMSLGSPFGFDAPDFDSDIEAVNNAAQVGMMVVSAAGNDGDTFFISGSPGAGHNGLSVAASVDNGQTITQLHVSTPAAADFAAQASGFTNPNGIAPPQPAGQSANIVLALDAVGGASKGCGSSSTNVTPGAFSNGAALTNNFALIDRGTCSFYIKVLNAQAAGAAGVIVDDSTVEALIFMGNPGTTLPTPITIPSLFVSQATGTTLKADLATPPVAATFNAILQPQLADTLASFSSRGPVIDENGAVELKPDLAAPGLNIPSAQTGITCNGSGTTGCITPSTSGFIPGGQPLTISGTSMATPHVAGMVALLRQLNPSATVEQIKAMAINTASHGVTQGTSGTGNIYGASRVGAGRVDVADASKASVLAYNADEPGAVAVTFDVEPTGSAFSATHKVTLANRTAAPKTVTLSVQDVLSAPGVSFMVPSGSITIPASGTASFDVTFNADTSSMLRYIDPSMATTQHSAAFNANFVRQYIAERSALILVNVGGSEVARVPVYAAVRPHSNVVASVNAAASTSTNAVLSLAGSDVCTGTVSPTATGTTCSADVTTGEESFVSAFELQYTGTQDATLPGWANLHYIGLNSAPDPDGTDTDVFFGVSTFGRWGTQGKTSINICVDSDGDGLFDKVLFNTDMGTLDSQNTRVAATSSEDTFFTFVYTNSNRGLSGEFPVNLFDASQLDSGALSNNSLILPVLAADLGVTGTNTKIRYGIAVCPGYNNLCGIADWTPGTAQGTAHCGTDSSAFQKFDGPLTYDTAAPGIDGQFGAMFAEDLNGNTVNVAYSAANLSANQSTGILLLHTHNTAATSAQIVVPDRIFADGFEGN